MNFYEKNRDRIEIFWDSKDKKKWDFKHIEKLFKKILEGVYITFDVDSLSVRKSWSKKREYEFIFKKIFALKTLLQG